MNRATLGLSAILFSFLCLAVMGFTRNDSAASGKERAVTPKLSPTMTLIPKKDSPSDTTPTPSPYVNPSGPKPKPSPYKNPSDPTPTPSPYKNPSDPTPTPKNPKN